MKIGIDASTWTNRRGYGRFTRELVKAMVESYPEHEFVLVVDAATAAQGEFPEGAALLVVATREQQIQAASADGSRQISDLWRMARAVARARFDVFFFPTRYSYFPLFCSTPTVVAFHDATAERHPKLIFPGFRSRLLWRIKSRLALWRADRLVTVSHDARAQLSDVFKYPAESITVISEGPDPIFGPRAEENDVSGIRQQFEIPSEVPIVLYVGGISPHKNLQGLIRALEHVPGPWHLVLVGDYKNDSFWGCYNELVDLLGENGLKQRVTFTGFVSDEQLRDFYHASTMLVLPSMSEGFGLPVVEAMACGLPVAASARNSIPEVLGDAGLLFDPTSTQEIADCITRLLKQPQLRDRLRQLGLARAEFYSWKNGARNLVEVLESTRAG
jgi:glycosyltransferase involved in cell wall biosynthesis